MSSAVRPCQTCNGFGVHGTMSKPRQRPLDPLKKRGPSSGTKSPRSGRWPALHAALYHLNHSVSSGMASVSRQKHCSPWPVSTWGRTRIWELLRQPSKMRLKRTSAGAGDMRDSETAAFLLDSQGGTYAKSSMTSASRTGHSSLHGQSWL